ncbi:cell division protein ZipA [Vibrio navarrensis]|uniref:Cell division protein ZipA n=1 Tax=Vibrio navarrensis TaxID=29495 RepID=A0AAI9G9I2_9VIBR|nr:cell division protein ZipA [Vibrio navarrensis]EJL6394500.1 cell division protein ZipA [Vibrio navarrensis]EKA5635470.1 cell division protein ZipA [Vibrio navarrensis]ELN6932961.1 cell division protein ZipA [Vibrio navarrensis]
MQELRFVLIVVGALAIAALLFHGLWTSKKEGKAKFGDKPLSKLDLSENETQENTLSVAPEDDFEIIRKERKEPAFEESMPFSPDPLIGDPLIDDLDNQDRKFAEPAQTVLNDEVEITPSFSASEVSESYGEEPIVPSEQAEPKQSAAQTEEAQSDPEPEMEVIVLNVHCAGEAPFVGTRLFDSMQQNGLIYGEMDIFHRHADLSGNGKVLFSVANMMHPGTLKHDDPATFTTKGISFFMTLPCYGDAEQNFKLMLKTAQQIADDLGGNVLDDRRNLMTPDRLAAYRRQIVEFKSTKS